MTAASLTDAKGVVVACRAVADLPNPFVANWYVHCDCGGKLHTLRYARTDDRNVPGLRVQFITGPVHNSFVGLCRAEAESTVSSLTPDLGLFGWRGSAKARGKSPAPAPRGGPEP